MNSELNTEIQKEEVVFECNLPDPSKPPEYCFTCGNKLPEQDFELFHQLTERLYPENYVPTDKDCNDYLPSRNIAEKIVLDKHLSKVYVRKCCRSMFMGDPYLYRTYMSLYDYSTINLDVKY